MSPRGQKIQDELYILHKRPFCKEGHILLNCLSRKNILITTVARQQRSLRSGTSCPLQLFGLLDVHYDPNANLPRLSKIHHHGAAILLRDDVLAGAFYVNEITYKLLNIFQGESHIFEHYTHCIYALSRQPQNQQPILRCYEHQLFRSIGMAITYPLCPKSTDRLIYMPQEGLVNCPTSESNHLRAKHCIEPTMDMNAEQRQTIKHLHRKHLAFLLGSSSIQTKAYWQ